MHTLLLRLVGPMQSWGTQSRFSMRDTLLEPSKSGVIGLLCAADGKRRDDVSRIQELADRLKMGVRVDCEGRMECDYQTALNIRSSDETKSDRASVGRRYYLADASFLVGLEAESRALLDGLQDALRNPQWPLYLGRKAFVPSQPVRLKDGLRENADLLTILRTYPWLGRAWQRKPERLRFVIEHREGDLVPPDQAITQVNDQPLSFDVLHRDYAPRRIRTIIEPPAPQIFSHLEKSDEAAAGGTLDALEEM
jgi:CRISPR system Cascade subunit CasD